MEAPEPLLSVESFSYRWLIKLDQTPDGPSGSFRKFLEDEGSSFIEMDPAMPPSRRFSITSSSHDFKFDFPVMLFPLDVVHADDLFAEGHLLPFFFDPLKIVHSEHRTWDSSQPRKNDSQHVSGVVTRASVNTSASSTGMCQRLPKKIFLKHLNFLETFYKIFRLRLLSLRTKLGRKRCHGTGNWVYPEESASSSLRISSALSSDDGRKSSISECSIYEAVLHCKKSIGRESD